MKPSKVAVLLLSSVVLLCAWNIVSSCNETVCASIVSKCMLTQSCKCDLKNATCSRDCFVCLDYLYSECCSCVEMCPKPNETESALSQKSHVEDLPDPIPELFSVLTEEKDRLLRWTSYTFPAQISFVDATGDKEIKFSIASTSDTPTTIIPDEDIKVVNCTVAYMSQCMSWNKCKSSCRSMGASSYRWFHDGCCECAGSTCLNYGIPESRCLDCPMDKDEMLLEDGDEEVIIDNPEKETHTSVEDYGYDEDDDMHEEQSLHEKLPPSSKALHA